MKYEDVDTKGSTMTPFIQITSFWWQGRQWGCTLDIVDMRVEAATATVCPFWSRVFKRGRSK